MKTIKNKLLSLLIIGLGVYSAHISNSLNVAALRLAFFAVPALILFFAKRSIFINDYIEGEYKQ